MTKRAKAKTTTAEDGLNVIHPETDATAALSELADRNPDLVRQMQDALARGDARPARAQVKQAEDTEKQGAMELVADSFAEHLGAKVILQDALGSSSPSWRNQMLLELAKLTGLEKREPGETLQAMSAALAMVGAINPKDELEAALAVQMVGAHLATTDMLQRVGRAEYVEHVQTYVGAAVKLGRLFTGQAEALAKLRSAGKQTVEVIHLHKYETVNVLPGANAIVGNIHHQGGGVRGEIGAQPHERDGTMWGEDAAGLAMSGPCDLGQATLPAAWGAQPRRAFGIGERELPERPPHSGSQGVASDDRRPVEAVAGTGEKALRNRK